VVSRESWCLGSRQSRQDPEADHPAVKCHRIWRFYAENGRGWIPSWR